MRIRMKYFLFFIAMVFLATPLAGAAEIRNGAVLQVKANSIWFQDAARLTQWRRLKSGGDQAALATYEDEALSKRDAWRFTEPLTVKVLAFDRGTNQVKVEMTAEGRMKGTEWLIDAGSIAP